MRTTPPFRADHVGSLLRPASLLAARDDFAAGRSTPRGCARCEDHGDRRCCGDAAGRGAAVGDRRRVPRAPPGTWTSSTRSAGSARRRAHLAVKFHNPAGDIEWTPAALHVGSKLRMDKTIFGDDFSYLQSVVPRVMTAKLTIPSPNMVHYRGGPAAIDPKVYPDIDGVLGRPGRRLRRRGGPAGRARAARYLQFDDTSLAYLNDPAQRAEIAARGEDADHMHLRYIRQVNAALAGQADRADRHHAPVPRQLPLLLGRLGRLRLRRRGAVRRAWRWTGSSSNTTTSAPAASSRCGSSRPARWSCSGWSPPRRGALEDPDDCSSAASTPAAKYVPLDQLCLSGQCGFSSTVEGNALDPRPAARQARAHRQVAQGVWAEPGGRGAAATGPPVLLQVGQGVLDRAVERGVGVDHLAHALHRDPRVHRRPRARRAPRRRPGRPTWRRREPRFRRPRPA